MATKTNHTQGQTPRDHLLTLLESKTTHLAEKFRRQQSQLTELRSEKAQLLEEQERLKLQIRALEQKLAVRGDTTTSTPILELREEVSEMITLVDQCLDLLENGIR